MSRNLHTIVCPTTRLQPTMERALPIDEYVAFDSSVEDTGDISNMTAEQYLSWVRYQADEMPDVFRAEIDSSLYTGKQTKYMPDIEKVDVCPEHLLPSTEWERDVIVAFSDLRALLARLSLSEASRERKLVVPQLKDEQAWHKFCLGSEYCTDSRSNMSGQMDIDGSKIPSSSSFDIEQRKLELSESLGITKSAGDIDDSAVVTTDASPEDDSDEEEGVDSKAQKSVPDGYPTWSGVEDSLPTTSVLLQLNQIDIEKEIYNHLSCNHET